MNKHKNLILVNWYLKRAVINFNEIEDDETKVILENVKNFCRNGEFFLAIEALPQMSFEFNATNMDSSSDRFLTKSTYDFFVDLKNKNHSVKVGLQNDELILSISINFELNVTPGLTTDDLDEWLDENGGWAAATAAGQWSYSEDDGGHFQSVSSIH